ncbi:holin [Kitasatospora sp. A2-31]|uniref:holin n=1 Tax=Kitasatospora sp. A2-31 TaxID=2916414 RepID=UPI001EEEBCDE|nr:holin [Kitasatospora sp. A2-31]MCG6499450.1 holin [Kitasatospora sp. A2-31]
MTRRRALTVCTVAGCPELTPGGRCPTHQAEAERARGTRTQRGYGQQHRIRFRPGVLQRDPLCVCTEQGHGHGQPCGQPSQHADHWPLSRRELVAAGDDPDDPRHGRGLCHRCHSRETALHQPGGWADR